MFMLCISFFFFAIKLVLLQFFPNLIHYCQYLCMIIILFNMLNLIVTTYVTIIHFFVNYKCSFFVLFLQNYFFYIKYCNHSKYILSIICVLYSFNYYLLSSKITINRIDISELVDYLKF